MKNQALKAIIFALSIVSMPALHAMNEQENNQSYLQCAAKYVKNIDYKYTGLYAAGFALSLPIGIAAHELGHAVMAEAIEPGSVKHIEILSTTPHIKWLPINNPSPMQQIAVYMAGPVAGAVGSYATAKGLQLICSYQKKKSLSKALQETRNASMLTSLSESPIISGLQNGLATLSFTGMGLTQMYSFQTPMGLSDGGVILRIAIRNLCKNPFAIPYGTLLLTEQTWNAIIQGIQTTTQAGIDIDNYLTHLNKLISQYPIDNNKKIVISPSILSSMLLASYYYDKDHPLESNPFRI